MILNPPKKDFLKEPKYQARLLEDNTLWFSQPLAEEMREWDILLSKLTLPEALEKLKSFLYNFHSNGVMCDMGQEYYRPGACMCARIVGYLHEIDLMDNEMFIKMMELLGWPTGEWVYNSNWDRYAYYDEELA